MLDKILEVSAGVVMALVMAFALFACDAPSNSMVSLQATLEDYQTLKDTCAGAKTLLDQTTAKTAPAAVSDVAIYPKAFCAEIAAGHLGKATKSSLSWLPGVLTTVAKIAVVAIPLVL